MKYSKFIIIIALMISSLPGFSQERITSEEKKAVIVTIEKFMDSTYVFPEVAKEAMALLKENEKQGIYSSTKLPEEFARTLTEDLRSITNDLHIKVKFDPESIAEEKNKKIKTDLAAGTMESLKRENFGFNEVKILDGNIGYLDLRLFISPEYAAETAIAAMNFLANTDAIIFDLRNNRGGSPEMIQLIQSYLFGAEPVHLNNFYNRPTNKHMQTWTLPHVPGKRNPNADVYVLTSKRSFSAAEEFAFNIKNLERGTLIGETTAGAANPGSTQNINDSFIIFIPSGRAYSPITNTNWEGTGVIPHIQVPEKESLTFTHLKALENLSRKTADDKKKAIYEWYLKIVKAKKEPIILNSEQLNSYAGSYGGNKILFKKSRLIYERAGMQFELIPLGEHEFTIRNKSGVRLQFSEDRKNMNEILVSGKTRTLSRD
ncbi:MAG: S41 family peptidase [Bacteroidota bacterium]